MRNFLRKYAEMRGHVATALKLFMDDIGDKAPPKDSYLKLNRVSGNFNPPPPPPIFDAYVSEVRAGD
jgi:hypothetical protein